MKCDELKSFVCGGWCCSEETYHKKDVDEAIAELKQKLEDVQTTAYADSVDSGMRERRLKRALWLARAEKAKTESKYWYAIYVFEKKEEPYTIKHNYWREDEERFLRPIIWCEIWRNVEKLCLKKAEEYK